MRPIYEIAQEIKKTWNKPYFGAIPYIEAMLDLKDMTSTYGMDSARSIVLYFLSNSSKWRGVDARRIKEELKKHLANKEE